MEETPKKYSLPSKGSLKSQKTYTLISDKKASFNVNFKNFSSYIEIQAKYKDNMTKNEFKEKFFIEKLKLNKFLSIYDSVDEIYEEIINELSKNNPILVENEDNIIINIPIGLTKFKEIVFVLNKQTKSVKDICGDLYDIVFDLKNQINKIEIDKNEKNEKIKSLNKETEELKKIINDNTIQINNINQKIQNLSNDNKILKEKINSLENELSQFKNGNSLSKENSLLKDNLIINENLLSPKENINILNEKTDLKTDFIKIDNPWTKEIEKDARKFEYILKDGNYYAEKKNGFISSIKSKHKFEKNKIYKVIYNISFKEEDYRVGFGDFGDNISRLKEKGSVGFTNEGLYIDGKKIKDIILKENNKIITFIINLKENKYFELYADEIFLGKFEFDLNNIFGLAAIDKGNSVAIKTFQKT